MAEKHWTLPLPLPLQGNLTVMVVHHGILGVQLLSFLKPLLCLLNLVLKKQQEVLTFIVLYFMYPHI